MAKIIQFPMSENPPIVWADISRYNASNPEMPPVIHFDFDKYQAKGAPMICLRGQVANAGRDFELEYNLGQCRQRGLPYTLYHPVKLWHSIPNQAAAVGDLINEVKGDPLYRGSRFDIENNDGLNKTIFTGNAEKIFNQTLARCGELLGLYTRAYFWDQQTYPDTWMKEIRWWIAHHFYGLSPYSVPNVRPLLPACIAEINNPIICTDWQFDTHDQGAEWGSMGDDEIDLNFFTWDGGTHEAFAQVYGVTITPPAPPGDEIIPIGSFVVTSQFRNLRTLPNASGAETIIGQAQRTSRLPYSAEQGDWKKVEAWVWKAENE